MLISIVSLNPVKFSPSDFGYKVVGFLILLAIYRFLLNDSTLFPLKILLFLLWLMYTIDDNNYTLELRLF